MKTERNDTVDADPSWDGERIIWLFGMNMLHVGDLVQMRTMSYGRRFESVFLGLKRGDFYFWSDDRGLFRWGEGRTCRIISRYRDCIENDK